jgi:predicted restriction endonuclease
MDRVLVSIEDNGSLLAKEVLVGQRTEWKQYWWSIEQSSMTLDATYDQGGLAQPTPHHDW